MINLFSIMHRCQDEATIKSWHPDLLYPHVTNNEQTYTRAQAVTPSSLTSLVHADEVVDGSALGKEGAKMTLEPKHESILGFDFNNTIKYSL